MKPFVHRRSRHPGFTLIEVLVVVAIIALLISILMPSLRQAREQAKIVTCLAHLSQIGKGAGMYLNATRDRFCWGPGPHVPWSSSNQNEPLTRTWYFGGNRGQNSASLATGGFYVTGSSHDWSPAQRPLNRYVYSTGKLSKTDQRPLWKEGDIRVYECPSDQGVRWNGNPNSTLKGVPAYLEVGTSYQANNSWTYYAKQREYASGSVDSGNRIKYLMNRIVPILAKKGASRGVLIYEDPADWALNTAASFPSDFKVPTWHNKFDIHNVLFLDGHGAQLSMDWRKNAYGIDKAGTAQWQVRQYYREEGKN